MTLIQYILGADSGENGRFFTLNREEKFSFWVQPDHKRRKETKGNFTLAF